MDKEKDEKTKDIKFSNEKGSFNTRVVGACIKDGKILLCKMQGDKHWTLIGGKVKFGENSGLAVLREYNEETGSRLQLEKLVAIIENFFMVENEKWHQFIFLYLLKDDFNELKLFDGERKILDNKKITMQWFNINELNKIFI